MINNHIVSCPYCGESFEALLDCSIESQQYIEDCYVCCQPIMFTVTADCDGNLVQVTTAQENE